MQARARDVVVVGGGLVGLSSALALQKQGLSTTLIDAGRSMRSASFGNAGHIAVEQVRPLAHISTLKSAPRRLYAVGGPLDFRLRDAAAWAPWAARYMSATRAARAEAGERALGRLLARALPAWRRLVTSIGRHALLVEDGHLMVWESASSAKAGAEHWSKAPSGEATTRPLVEAERSALARNTAVPFIGGLGFDGTGQVSDPGLAMAEIEGAFRSAGGEVLTGVVRRLRRASGLVGLELDGWELWPGLVVVAGGVGSGALLRGLGHAAPVVAERGYHIEGPTDGWAELPPVVFADRSVVVTRFGERLRATSFVEFARADSPADQSKWRKLERHAVELGLPFRGPLSRWIGARPTLPDYLPAIGRSRRASNLIYAFGHQHLGLTLAPLTGEIVADLACGRAPEVELAPYALERFDLRRFDLGRRNVGQGTR